MQNRTYEICYEKKSEKVQNGKEIEWIEKKMDVHGLHCCNNESNFSFLFIL
jgi:hypothetical protein